MTDMERRIPTLDERTLRRIDRVIGIVFLVVGVWFVAVVLADWDDVWIGDGDWPAWAPLFVVTVGGLWSFLRRRLSADSSEDGWGIYEDDGYRGPLPPEKQFPR